MKGVEVRKMAIVLAEDHTVIRSALRVLLESQAQFDVVAEAGTLHETLSAVTTHRPDVLLLDLHMPDGFAIPSIPTLRSIAPQMGIVVLTASHAPGVAIQAIRAGAHSYLLKDATDTDLLRAVDLAAQGRPYLQPEMGALLVTRDRDEAVAGELRSRELDVLRLLALGHTRREIADQLQISVRTVESRRARIQQKLSLTTRAALVRYALAHGLIEEATDDVH